MRRKLLSLTLGVAAFHCLDAAAAVSADEAKQLGGSALTIFGAEKAGNKEGTIPAYTAETVKAPPGHVPGEYADPWNEKPLYSITAQSYAKYEDKIDAMAELFKRFPNYRMDVYPTHRTMVFPKFFLDNTLKNATSCKAVEGELVLEGCYGGVPFPIPKTGAETMWNHLFTYQGYFNKADFGGYVVASDGTVVLQVMNEGFQLYPMFDPTRTVPAKGSDTYWGYRSTTTGPSRRVGEKLLILDAVDSLHIGRRAWQYIPGQRRVKLAPDLAYDTPSPYGAGSITMDESKGFLGALDRFEWKLLGKKEKYILSNAFKVNDYKTCPPEVFHTKQFPNPDCVRWELHRVWKVEGKLKPGYRHIYNKRVLFWDEDGYSGGSTEAYDAAGKLFRLGTVISYPFYDGTGMDGGGSLHQDMQTGVWASQGYAAAKGQGFYALPPIKDSHKVIFSPENMAGEGIR